VCDVTDPGPTKDGSMGAVCECSGLSAYVCARRVRVGRRAPIRNERSKEKTRRHCSACLRALALLLAAARTRWCSHYFASCAQCMSVLLDNYKETLRRQPEADAEQPAKQDRAVPGPAWTVPQLAAFVQSQLEGRSSKEHAEFMNLIEDGLWPPVHEPDPPPPASPPVNQSVQLDEQPASAPTVQFLGEVTREQRDAELLQRAVEVSSSSSDLQSPSPVAFGLDDVPASLSESQRFAYVKRVLAVPVDHTLEMWCTRAFHEDAVVRQYARFSGECAQQHRDAAEALAALSDPDQLGVSAELRSANPETTAEAWHFYRKLLINALHRAFAAGVDWRRALRSLSILYSGRHGHPVLEQLVNSALTDHHLVNHPPLHADVLIFQWDVTFGAGSRLYGPEGQCAEWDRTTRREPGETPITLANRVVDAYLRKSAGPEGQRDDGMGSPAARGGDP